MKFKKTKKRLEIPAKVKPKRLDLNPNQKVLLEQVRSLSEGQVLSYLEPLQDLGLSSLWFESLGNFYLPDPVGEALGWSPSTVEKYHYLYHRVVRRGDEAAAAFRSRKASLQSPEAPLFEGVRLISPRAMLFLVLAPAYLRGSGREALRAYRQAMSSQGFRVGKAKTIGVNSATTSWVTEPSHEVTIG